jgi:hypothetical protein
MIRIVPSRLRAGGVMPKATLMATLIMQVTAPVTKFKQPLLAGSRRATTPLPISPKSPITNPNS